MDSMDGKANKGSVEVEIFGQAFKLRGTDTEHIVRLAEYVDAKMPEVADKTSRSITSAWLCSRH